MEISLKVLSCSKMVNQINSSWRMESGSVISAISLSCLLALFIRGCSGEGRGGEERGYPPKLQGKLLLVQISHSFSITPSFGI